MDDLSGVEGTGRIFVIYKAISLILSIHTHTCVYVCVFLCVRRPAVLIGNSLQSHFYLIE